MRLSSWGSRNLGRVGGESGAEAGLLHGEVDELLVREAGAAHFRFLAGTVVTGESKGDGARMGRDERLRGRVGESYTYTGTFCICTQDKDRFTHKLS